MDNVIIFTSNNSGGIAQFALKLAQTISKYNIEVTFMVPENFIYEKDARYSKISITKYMYTKLNDKTKLNNIFKIIIDINPSLIIFTDSTIQSLQIAKLIKNRLKQLLVLHDVNPHFTYFNPKQIIKVYIWKRMFKRSINLFRYIIFLSNSNKNKFDKKYINYKGNTIVIPLGAHLIKSQNENHITELLLEEEFLLFFGRLDKYKGIKTLLSAYLLDNSNELPKLIIAGKGILTKCEISLINKLKDKVIVFNKYISEDEIIQLFTKSIALILPYKEASQSGVIPLAYQFKKPVIASDLPGLSEFVENNITGFLFKANDSLDLYNCLKKLKLCDASYLNMCKNAREYSLKYLDWDTNINKFLDGIV